MTWTKQDNCFLRNKINQMHQFHKFILSWNSTCFGQFVCPSSGVYSLYTQQWYMSYSCHKVVFKPVWHIPLLSVQWIDSWWWTDELPETCRVSWQNKFVKLVHLVGFITKKYVTMHGHMNIKKKAAFLMGQEWPCYYQCKYIIAELGIYIKHWRKLVCHNYYMLALNERAF